MDALSELIRALLPLYLVTVAPANRRRQGIAASGRLEVLIEKP